MPGRNRNRSFAPNGIGQGPERYSPVVLSGAQIHSSLGRSLQLAALPSPMWGISRQSLDSYLLEMAKEAGAYIVQPARCEAIDHTSPRTIRVRLLESNKLVNWTGNHIVVADGKGSLSPPLPRRTSDFGIKGHFRYVDGPRDVIELFGCDGFYGGLAAIEDDRWNCAFSVPESLLRKHRGDIDGMFRSIRSQNKALNQRLRPAERVTDWLAAPLPRFAPRNDWSPGVIPIGNAAGAIEPIGGEGMGLALKSAQLAAEAFLNSSLPSLPAAYRKIWRTPRPACRFAAQVVSRPRLSISFEPLLRTRPAQNAILWLQGK